MTDGAQEQHLAKLLKEFNKDMYLDCVVKAEKVISDCSDQSLHPQMNVIKSADRAGDLAFRVSFSFPVFLMLSHPICKFRSHRNYPMRERFFIANLGLVPVFCPTLDIMTVLKLWGERASSFFNPTNSPLTDSTAVCWELPSSSISSEYSSMNFVIQNSSQPEIVEEHLSHVLEKYFTFAFWSFPRPGFTPSTHFLHGETAISSQIKVAKSLYVIDEIGRMEKIVLEGKTIEAIRVKMRGLMRTGRIYQFTHFEALIDIDIANAMMQKENLETTFVNGIVSEVKQRMGKHSLMTVVAEYGKSSFDVISALIGIVADEKYSETSSVVSIGSIDELRERVYDLYLDIRKNLQITMTLSDLTPNLFDLALNYMFPILFREQRNVVYIHPLVWSFLKKWNLIRNNEDEQKKILHHIVRLMELTKQNSSSALFFDESADYISRLGPKKRNMVQSIFQLVKEIRFTKILKGVLVSQNQTDNL
jgi:hypothetical protein